MVHPAFISVLLLLAVFAVRLGCAQDLAVQSAPLPVIEGKINGMEVVAQGDSVAFFAGQLPGEYSDESCAEDLHCTLHKNHTRAVQISPKGIRLLQLNPDHLEKDEDEENNSSSIVLPSQTLNTLDSSSSFSFKELFISTEEIEPTPTLATLYTGNPVVDQTPGLEWINSETMKLLATMIETVNLLPMSTSSADDESTLIDPAPTEIVKVMTTISGELDELRGRLMSSATVPVATPVLTNSVGAELESDEILLETHTDILMIRPSPSWQHGSSSRTSGSLAYTVKQVDTSSGGGTESTSQSNEPTSSAHDAPSTETLQTSPSPVLSGQHNPNTIKEPLAGKDGDSRSVAAESNPRKRPGQAAFEAEGSKKNKIDGASSGGVLELPERKALKKKQTDAKEVMPASADRSPKCRYCCKKHYKEEWDRRINHIRSKGECFLLDEGNTFHRIMDRPESDFPPKPDISTECYEKIPSWDPVHDRYSTQSRFEMAVESRRRHPIPMCGYWMSDFEFSLIDMHTFRVDLTLRPVHPYSEEDQSTPSHFSDNTANNDQKGRVAEYTEWWKLPAEEESEDQSGSELDSNYSACSCEEVPSDYDIPPSPKKVVDRSRFPGSIPDDIMEKVVDAELKREQLRYDLRRKGRGVGIKVHKLKHKLDYIEHDVQLSRQEKDLKDEQIEEEIEQLWAQLRPLRKKMDAVEEQRNQLINEHHQRFCPECKKRMVWDEHGHEVSFEGGDPCTKFYYMCFKCRTHEQLFYDSWDYNLEWPDGHTCPDPYQ